MHVAQHSLSELSQTTEFSEFEAIWTTDSPCPQPDPLNPVTQYFSDVCKFARYHYSGHLVTVRSGLAQMLGTILTSASLLEQFATSQDQHTAALAEWLASNGDFADAVLVALAKHNGIPHILSDDADMATFAGITLYTANQRTITGVATAGRLV